MHRRAVVCTMCGGKFFPASLEFHQKACARKQNFVLIPCPYCDVEVPKPELETHISTACKKAPKSAHKPKDAAAGGQGEYPEGGEGGEPLFDEAGRMCCPVCNRWFNQDRIGKHQAICRKLEEKGKRKRPVFDSFKQRKFDPLIQRSDIEERQAKALESGAIDASTLKAARSYYTTERLLEKSGKEALPSVSTKSSVAPAAKKSKGPAATAGEGAETGKPPTTARRASGASTTQQSGGSRKPRDEPAVSSPSRPTTTTGGRRASDTGTRVAKKPAPGPSTVAAARSAAAGAKAGEAGHSPTAQKNKQRPSLQNRSARGPPFRMGGGGNDARNVGSPAIGRRGLGGGGGGGAILETNEASAENTLAYPNYPATGYDLRSRPDVTYASPSPTRTARPPPPRASQAVNLSRGAPAARGAILPTNETSADNPLAYPFQ